MEFSCFEEVKDRFKALTVEKGEKVQLTVNGIELVVLGIRHRLDFLGRNSGYLSTIGGLRILHMGDSLLTYSELEVFELPPEEIDGDYVIWEDYRNGNKDIYGYNLSTGEEFQITTDPEIQSEPAIYGDLVVWTDWRNGNWDIYGYNLSKERSQIWIFLPILGVTYLLLLVYKRKFLEALQFE